MQFRRNPPHAVDRPDLRRQLDVGVRSPLSLVVAPAGAGKTVLLTQWAHSRPDVAVVWFDVAADDESVEVFAQRLIDGIADAVPGFHPPTVPVSASEARLGEPFLEEIAARLAEAGEVALVFDDLDRLTGTPILVDLWRLVDLLPASAHAIFSSRVDLSLGWSRHRLQHGLVEIRQRELAFDEATTARVIEAITGSAVSPGTASAVTAKTEGWAVGVQLTALSLRFATDPERVVDRLAETDRRVVDYLSEEVLDAAAPERRAALMRLAVLDEVCADLAGAVAGIDGDEFLRALERDSLFIVPVPGRPGWLRFHRLFRDLLLYRLRAHDRDAEARVLEAAADWFLARGEFEAAVDCVLRARHWDRALDLVLGSGRDEYTEVRVARIMRWLSLVPSEVREARLDAEVLLAMTEGMCGLAVRAADRFQSLLQNDRLTMGQRQATLAYLAAEVQFLPHPESSLETADQALALLAAHPDAVRPDLLGLTSQSILVMVGEVSRARALLMLGRLVDALTVLEAVADAGEPRYAPYRVHTLGSLALVEVLSGRVMDGTAHAREALDTATELGLRGHPAPADAHLALAFAAVQRGRPEAGMRHLAEGAASAASNNRIQLMWFAHLATCLIHPHEEHVDAEPPNPPPPFVRRSLAALTLRRTRLRGVTPPSFPPSERSSPVALEEIAALLSVGDAVGARARLAQSSPDARSTPVAVVEFDLLTAWLLLAEGRRAQARERLAAALTRAEPEELVHPFVRVGPALLGLLDDVSGSGRPFAAFAAARVRAETAPRDERLVDELTPRERELLTYLPTRFTIADIADRCFVSSNTVKTHLGHIYRKLGVAGRDAAIERALELGLLEQPGETRVG